MMLTLSNKIQNIQSYILKNRLNYYVSKGKFICENRFEKDIFTSPLNNFVLFNGSFYISDWNGKYFVFDSNGNSSDEGNGKAFINCSNYYLFYQFMDGSSICEGLLNKQNETLMLSLTPRKRYVNDSNEKTFFYIDNDSIKSFSILESKINWDFNYNVFPTIPNKDFLNPLNPWEVKKIIGIIDGKLWLAMNHRTIFALSILNGDLIFNISNIPDFHKTEVHDSIPLPEATYILEDENKLIGFIGRYYWEINATNGEIQITDKTVDFLNEKISNDNEKFVLDKELIFFINNSSQICCFNRKTHFIDWRYSFDKIEPEYRIQLIEIQGNRNKLGVKDLNNNLYIFEETIS